MNNLKTVQTFDTLGEPLTIHYGFENHFTITASGKDYCGCCHDEILAAKPDLAPFVALHLSDRDGKPMHALLNGWYWMAGALGGAGEEYSGLDGTRTAEHCLQIFADHCRIDLKRAGAIRDFCQKCLNKSNPNAQGWLRACTRAKTACLDAIQAMAPRWKAEADTAFKLLTA